MESCYRVDSCALSTLGHSARSIDVFEALRWCGLSEVHTCKSRRVTSPLASYPPVLWILREVDQRLSGSPKNI